MNSFNAYNDIRRHDFYLSKKEQIDWDSRNILYNTIWFYRNKSNKYPEVEYSDIVTDIYKFISPKFESWSVVYHEYGKVFDPPGYVHTGKRGRFCADLMTGWWNPFKYFLGLSDSITRETIEKMSPPSKKEQIDGTLSLEEIEVLTPEIINKAEKTEIYEWFKEKNKDIEIKHIHKFFQFLKVIYTIGNIIPAPINWHSGKSLDSWDFKFNKIKQNFNSKGPIELGGSNVGDWYRYIKAEYNDFDEFIRENDLFFPETTFINEEMVSFFGKDIDESFVNLTVNEWTDFFTNAKEFINKRNKAIQDVLDLKISER